MDKFTELYNYLKEEGLTQLSAEEFQAEYAAGTAKNAELFSYLKEEELTALDAEKFNLEYFPALEKKIQTKLLSQMWRRLLWTLLPKLQRS
jgi:hypothetical protein